MPSDAERELARRRDDGAPLIPVLPPGKGPKLGQTFWGQAWQHHLAACTDYQHTLPRGRALLRQGRVYDVTITAGRVTAVVTDPITVRDVLIRLSPLEDEAVSALQAALSHQAGTWLDLLAGKWGDAMMQHLVSPEAGLLPDLTSLRASCTCEDWSDPCPHASAVLYALALRFDADPALFFTLRGLDPALLLPSDQALTPPAAMQLPEDELGDLFGIDLVPERP
jgi:uncharacterized Zn finger protein